MSDWQNKLLDELCYKVTDGSHTSPKSCDNGKHMLSVKDMTDYGFDFSKSKKISEEDFNNLVKLGCKPEIGDVLIAKDGSILKHIFEVKNNIDAVLLSSIAILKPIKDRVNSQFLVYLLKNPKTINYILNNFKSGTGVPRIVLKDFKKIVLSIPNILIQNRIVDLLSAFDKKIELNCKMNQTLEEMAQTIFKSWFVDFDPVHAKVNASSDSEYDQIAKGLGISREVLDLFPDEFEDSELGMIPKGWEVESLDNVAHYQNGLALQKFRPTNEKKFLPVLKIAQLKKGYANGEEKADPAIKPECIVDSGDVVFSWSGSLVVDVWCGGKVALNQHLFKVTSDKYSKWFYYFWTKKHLKNFQQIAADKAVTMGHIKRSHLAEALCAVPNTEVMNLAENIISPMIEKLIRNRLESFTLQKTRDTLLPKLLSGELDISGLELDDVTD